MNLECENSLGAWEGDTLSKICFGRVFAHQRQTAQYALQGHTAE